jgi:transcriptional regulator with XRE-family HTH domain
MIGSEEFSLRLKEAAGEVGIYSPREMARLLEVQEQSVKQWYQGKTRPNGKNLANLISLLNVRYEWLMYGKHSEGAPGGMVEPSNPVTDFSDAIAVLSGMGGLLLDRTSGIDREGAEKIGRTITQASRNADQAFQALLKRYLKHCKE